MSEYDKYLAKLADDYNSGCEPEQIEPDSRYHSGDYNCHNCDNEDCEHWGEYNAVKIKIFDKNKDSPLQDMKDFIKLLEN